MGIFMIAAWVALVAPALAAPLASVEGYVLDPNGRPVAQAIVTINSLAGASGATGLSVFSDEAGRFAFPRSLGLAGAQDAQLAVKRLGYEPLRAPADLARGREHVLVLQPAVNLAESAPASAWLQSLPDTAARAVLLSSCVTCHQFATPEVRDFATSLEDVRGADPAKVRELGWHAMSSYMRFKFSRMLERGFPEPLSYAFATDPANFLPTTADEAIIVETLKNHLPRRFDTLPQYDYGAPLAVTDQTVIREYAVPGPNGIREALLLGQPKQLWVVDFTGDRIVRIDPDSGIRRDVPVPFEGASGPHTLVRGADGALWVSMVFNGSVAKLDPTSGEWRLWELGNPAAPDGGDGLIYMHDMAYDTHFELAPDTRGRIWVTDTANNALSVFDPETGETASYPAPAIPGRSPVATLMYGLVMASDRRHLWYSQLWGHFGCFDTETLEYETVVEVPLGAAPRRPAMTEDDILYMPLFGSGRIVEYDTRARRQLGVYDLPDRMSAPYAVTWDPGRRVLWVVTSNTDVIYRFDPASKTFGVIPLPRAKTFLRMLDVDPDTGWLVTSAGNLPADTDGPRTALIIDPGDSVF